MAILSRLSTIKELPTVPETILKVQSLVASDTGDATALAHIIEEDPALASKILKVANSSYYTSLNKRISSVKIAVARLGFHEVWNISMAMSLIKHFSNRKSSLGYLAFWKHSIDAAYLMQTIIGSLSAGYGDIEKQDLFLAGLFHDIGILVLDQFFPETFEKIMELSLSNEVAFLSAERSVVGKETHPMIGGALLEIWKMRPTVIEAVRAHHSPGKSPENFKKYSVPLSIVEYVLCNGRIGSFEGALAEEHRESWASFGVTPDSLQQFFASADHQSAKIDMIIGFEKLDLGITTPLAAI
jgi:HD-like signal output (HDOD) protein